MAYRWGNNNEDDGKEGNMIYDNDNEGSRQQQQDHRNNSNNNNNNHDASPYDNNNNDDDFHDDIVNRGDYNIDTGTLSLYDDDDEDLTDDDDSIEVDRKGRALRRNGDPYNHKTRGRSKAERILVLVTCFCFLIALGLGIALGLERSQALQAEEGRTVSNGAGIDAIESSITASQEDNIFANHGNRSSSSKDLATNVPTASITDDGCPSDGSNDVLADVYCDDPTSTASVYINFCLSYEDTLADGTYWMWIDAPASFIKNDWGVIVDGTEGVKNTVSMHYLPKGYYAIGMYSPYDERLGIGEFNVLC